LAIWSLCLGEAMAFPAEHLDEAREALKASDKRGATVALDAAYSAFSSFEGVAADDVLATYWVYRGLLAHQRKNDDAAMDAFRQALVVDGAFEWDKALEADRELRKMFEALRGEVQSRDTVSIGVPQKMGCAQAYVDGRRVGEGDAVGVGRRLAQVQCPHGDVHGVWTDFDASKLGLDWIGLCPYPVDTSIEGAQEAPEDTLEAMLAFDEPKAEGLLANACLDLMALPPPAKLVKTSAPENQPPKSNDGESFFGASSWNSQRVLTVAAGSGLIAGGVIVHFVGVVPAYQMVEWGRRNPSGVSRFQADILTERFVQRRAISWSLMATGALTSSVGLFVFRSKPTGVSPWFSPTGAGLAGRF
jgi:hypothetical protein